nr:superoxide dismutase [Raoultella sp. NCTC 9187]
MKASLWKRSFVLPKAASLTTRPSLEPHVLLELLAPNAGGEPEGELAAAIAKSFGSFADFKAQFTDAAAKNFGAGWTWLVKNADGSLAIVSTSNAGRRSPAALNRC